MPKRKQSPEGSEGKEAPKVTKQEKPAPPKAEPKPKKPAGKNEDKGAKVKKSATKGKKDASAAQNGETKNEIYVSRPSVSVSSIRSMAPSSMSVRGQSDTVRVKGN
ncbi:high mobility group nucleosome-binding domain-containing protein 3 isoform X2 [Takifugu flavidus]|uniref:high mobility group nucleosome-binding domain-containing protein 3 isoform X2 n=1 Tax=Takifugu flavidus TaxID=433684 RepID=UPI002544812F|nr:high mobility group nucleosome-binding domain-containing protein 3 isoform X2 [Takifugu flavidus]